MRLNKKQTAPLTIASRPGTRECTKRRLSPKKYVILNVAQRNKESRFLQVRRRFFAIDQNDI